MCLSSPFVFIYIRLFPLKSNTPFTQIACFSAGLRHAASVAKAADSLGGAPGFQVAGRQVGSAAPPQTPAPPPTIEDGAQRFLGGEAGALACDGEAEGQRASVRREGWQCVWMRTPTTLTHTHAHRRAHTHARPRTLTHPRIHHTRPHRTLTPTHTFTRSHTHTHTPPTHTPHALTYTLSHSHSHTRAHHAHTYSHTHAHSHSHTPMRRDDSVNVHGDKACWGDGNSSWQLGDPRRCCAWRFGVWFWGLQACRVPDA